MFSEVCTLKSSASFFEQSYKIQMRENVFRLNTLFTEILSQY